MDTPINQNALPEVELGLDSKALLESTKSTIHGVQDNLSDIGDVVDYSKMTVDQIAREFKIFRKEHDTFRFEVRRIIADEIEKQVKPLQEQLAAFTDAKSKVIYIKWRFPFWEGLWQATIRIADFIWFIPNWTVRKTFGKIVKKGMIL